MRKFIYYSIIISVSLILIWLLIFNVLYPLKYQSEIITAAKTYQIDPVLIASIINAESGFDKNKVSPKNAIGLMQLLPSTAESISKDEIDLYDPATNITLGTKYLAYLIKKFNDIDTALFAYNAGEGNVARWLTERKEDKLSSCPFRETNAYVNKIKKSLKFYRGRI